MSSIPITLSSTVEPLISVGPRHTLGVAMQELQLRFLPSLGRFTGARQDSQIPTRFVHVRHAFYRAFHESQLTTPKVNTSSEVMSSHAWLSRMVQTIAVTFSTATHVETKSLLPSQALLVHCNYRYVIMYETNDNNSHAIGMITCIYNPKHCWILKLGFSTTI